MIEFISAFFGTAFGVIFGTYLATKFAKKETKTTETKIIDGHIVTFIYED